MRLATAVMWIGAAFVVAVLLIVFITMSWPAQAHSFYDKQCCGDLDCQPVACEDITAQDGGFFYRDPHARATYFFTRDKMKLSPDDGCHICLHRTSASGAATPLCLYLPIRTERERTPGPRPSF